MSAATPYPIEIRGNLAPSINRWLFLAKWLLIIPHIVVLVFLGIGVAFSWLYSLVAILFTGKYPEACFNYNVGVLRWLWRVGFYSYQALGTDQYPPFSLEPDANYPADITVQYPASLDKGRTFIQWWILAIPHYVILAVFQGGAGYHFGGLQIILVLFAAVANLFTGRYPRDLYALIMGINHWAYRVAGYALLFTNEYPPFRLGPTPSGPRPISNLQPPIADL
jgi:uncharacterized protein DUF4389